MCEAFWLILLTRLKGLGVKSLPDVLANRHGSIVTAVSELEDTRLVMIMNVDKVLVQTSAVYESGDMFQGINTLFY